MYKSEYLVGILMDDMAMATYVLVPAGLTLAMIFAIICNCAVIRLKDTLLRINLAEFSGGSLSVVFVVIYINSKLFELRKTALDRQRGSATSKLFRKALDGCRVYRMRFGSFYDADFPFIINGMSGVINATATLLIVF